MDKSIDDQLLREAREDGASRERIRIKEMLREEYRYWGANEDPATCLAAIGAMGALSVVLCRIDGLLPPIGDNV